jgi:serine/threonine protein kinase
VKLLDSFENEKNYCLVLELMQGGELYDALIEKVNLSEKEVHSLMVPIFDAVIYCHGLGIAHRDIKPENLLMTVKDPTQAILKISDFGFARLVNNGLATSDVGTPSYVAPEILM